jgi:DNA-binding response OmpR family regulator
MNPKILPDRPVALLVDDHADVLVTTGAFLETAGFDVIRAHNGDEALAHLASGQKFTLLVTDYAMPGLNGVDLATQALETFPALKTLIITGFPSDAGLFNRPSNVALMTKPFRRSELIAQLNALFGSEMGALQMVSSARSEGREPEGETLERKNRRSAARHRRSAARHRRSAARHWRSAARHRCSAARHRRPAARRRRQST